MKIRNLLNKNIKVILAFVIGLIISGSGVYAATVASSDVSYTNNSQSSVQGALDNLYGFMKNENKITGAYCYYQKLRGSLVSSGQSCEELCAQTHGAGNCSSCQGACGGCCYNAFGTGSSQMLECQSACQSYKI